MPYFRLVFQDGSTIILLKQRIWSCHDLLWLQSSVLSQPVDLAHRHRRPSLAKPSKKRHVSNKNFTNELSWLGVG